MINFLHLTVRNAFFLGSPKRLFFCWETVASFFKKNLIFVIFSCIGYCNSDYWIVWADLFFPWRQKSKTCPTDQGVRSVRGPKGWQVDVSSIKLSHCNFRQNCCCFFFLSLILLVCFLLCTRRSRIAVEYCWLAVEVQGCVQ